MRSFKTLIMCFIFVAFASKQTAAQALQVEVVEEDNQTIFMTRHHREFLNIIENQSDDLKRKISNTKASYTKSSGFSDTFFKVVLSEKKENIFKAHRPANFKMVYTIDETGQKVWSCALFFEKEGVFLSGSEIQAVLIEAMQHKFNYTNKPEGQSKFYFAVTRAYGNNFNF